MNKRLLDYHWWFVALLSFVLLVIYTFGFIKAKIDSISLILIAIILLSPYLSAIRKLKLGDFEAEIDPQEVKQLSNEAQLVLQTGDIDEAGELIDGLNQTLTNIQALVQVDRVLALAKLRIEIEKVLRELHRRQNLDNNNDKAPYPKPLKLIAHDLAYTEVIKHDLLPLVNKVLSVCNRAIHGEEIREEDAHSIVEVGLGLLGELFINLRFFSPKPVDINVISNDELNRYQDSKYRLTTVIPYVDKPERRTYILDQNGLDQFLEGYDEYAEFMVGLDHIPVNKNE